MYSTNIGSKAATIVKQCVNGPLSLFDLKITKKPPNQGCTLQWIEEAKSHGMEINDFIEKDQSKPALSELEELVFPYITEKSVVCELGPGTGCYTRYLDKKITDGEFHIVDVDPAAIDFLKTYLAKNPARHFHTNSGHSLPFTNGNWMDFIFCTSMFTGISLSYAFKYIQEFSRVLKPGGHCVFDYFDVSTEAGWQVLTKNFLRKEPVYVYNFHATETIHKIIDYSGLEVVRRFPTSRGSTFIIARKQNGQ